MRCLNTFFCLVNYSLLAKSNKTSQLNGFSQIKLNILYWSLSTYVSWQLLSFKTNPKGLFKRA